MKLKRSLCLLASNHTKNLNSGRTLKQIIYTLDNKKKDKLINFDNAPEKLFLLLSIEWNILNFCRTQGGPA